VIVTVKSFLIVGIYGKSLRPIVSVKGMLFPTSLGLDVERIIVVPIIVRKACD
jgi:hypothetical protein